MKPAVAAALALLALAVPAMAADLSITQKNQTFSQLQATVHVGEGINFLNEDDVTHNITIKGADGDSDDLGLQKPGVTMKYKFDAKGVYKVVCSIHPKMKMTVVAQ